MQEINKTDDLGIKIKNYLKNRGISQAFIVNQTGIAQEKISNSLNGKRKLTADEFLMICKALEISPNIFLD